MKQRVYGGAETFKRQMRKNTAREVSTEMYAHAVSYAVPVTNSDAKKIVEKPRRDRMQNQSLNLSIGILQ